MAAEPTPPRLTPDEIARLSAEFTEDELEQLIGALEERFIKQADVDPRFDSGGAGPRASAVGEELRFEGYLQERQARRGKGAPKYGYRVDPTDQEGVRSVKESPRAYRARIAARRAEVGQPASRWAEGTFLEGSRPQVQPGMPDPASPPAPMDLDAIVAENQRVFAQLMQDLSGTAEPAGRASGVTGATKAPPYREEFPGNVGLGSRDSSGVLFDDAPPPAAPAQESPVAQPPPKAAQTRMAAQTVTGAPGKPGQMPTPGPRRMFANLPAEGLLQFLMDAEAMDVPVSRQPQALSAGGFMLEAEPRPNMGLEPGAQPGQGMAGRLPLDAITRVLRFGESGPADLTDQFFEFARQRLPSAVGKTIPAFGMVPQLADLFTRFQLAGQLGEGGISPLMAADPTLDPRRFAGDQAYRDMILGQVQS